MSNNHNNPNDHSSRNSIPPKSWEKNEWQMETSETMEEEGFNYPSTGGLSGFCGFFTSPELKRISKNWVPFFFMGLTMIILGFLAIGSSFFVTILTVALIGVFLMVGGILQVVNAFYSGRWSGFLLHVVLGILYLVVGFMLLDAPMLNAITLTFLLASFFIVIGLLRIIGALTTHFPGWGWSLFNGMITFLLGVLIYKHWPSSGLWVIGLFVGIEMVFAGWYWIMFASGLRTYVTEQKREKAQVGA